MPCVLGEYVMRQLRTGVRITGLALGALLVGGL